MEQNVYLEMQELENRHWWFCARRDYLRKVISRFYKGDDAERRFCEIGCGTGGNLALLAEFAKVDAVEMNDAARDMARQKSVTGVNDINAGYLPDAIPLDQQYDGVFALDVIEHVEHDLAGTQALSGLVKDDGYLITTVPAYQWLWSEHDIANHHFRRYNLSQYKKLITDAGYDIVYASYFNTLLFPLAAISRLFSRASNNDNSQSDSKATLAMPSPVVNGLLSSVFRLETLWAGKLSMPFGLSIVVVARKRPGTDL